jgi:hypothetical protein
MFQMNLEESEGYHLEGNQFYILRLPPVFVYESQPVLMPTSTQAISQCLVFPNPVATPLSTS